MDLRQAVNDFYEEQEYKGNSPATVAFYRTNFEHFLRDTEIASLEEFDVRTIRSWLVGHKHLSTASVKTYDRSLRVLGNWLHRRGYKDHNPMADFPKPRNPSPSVETFSIEDVHAMLAEADRRRHSLRDRALITLLLDTGVRIGEAVDLELRDLHWREGYADIRGKTGDREVPFGRRCKKALRRYVDHGRTAENPRVQTVFLTSAGLPFTAEAGTQQVAKIAKACSVGAAKLGPHTFRHTFAVEFIRAGGDASSLQRLLGHSTLDMTRTYVHLANSDLRRAHRQFAPSDRLLGSSAQ